MGDKTRMRKCGKNGVKTWMGKCGWGGGIKSGWGIQHGRKNAESVKLGTQKACVSTGPRSPPTKTNSSCDWLIKTIKDNKTIEIEILKNES